MSRLDVKTRNPPSKCTAKKRVEFPTRTTAEVAWRRGKMRGPVRAIIW
jgi:hypothetical protein